MSPDDTTERLDRTAPGGLTGSLVRRITELIRSGELKPGDRLPTEGELAETHGVSRTVVREAMSRLNARGLVDTRHGRGSFVLTGPDSVPFSIDAHEARTAREFVEILEFRAGFEIEAAGLAAERASAPMIAAIQTAYARLADEARRPSVSLDADFAFHRSIAVASGNRHVVQLLDSLGRAAIAVPAGRLSPDAAETAGHLRFVIVEHENVARAIASRNAADARAAMRIHFANSRYRLTHSDNPEETP